MELLEGLEKFGLGQIDTSHMFESNTESREEENKAKKQQEKEEEKKVAARPHAETEYLLAKTMRCPVCDQVFRTLMLKTGRVKRLEPDFDLRPKFENIDTNKYDICSCPYCEYTAMHRYFPNLTPGQIKLLKENVQSRFVPECPVETNPQPREYSYEEAIEQYKLGLYCTMVKKGMVSEKAYACLKIAWLYRGLAEKIMETETGPSEMLSLAKKGEADYYEQAYDGLIKAVSTELFPICGMDEETMNILLASMAYKLGRYEVASKLISSVLISKSAGTAVKNRARDLKEKIIVKLRNPDS